MNNSPSWRWPESGLIIGGQVASQPLRRNGLVRALCQRFAIDDAARGSKLDRETGIVLVVNDPWSGFLTRRLADADLAADEVAELMDLLPTDDAILDRVEQFSLIVFDHAFPVVDDDGGCTFIGPSVDFRPFIRNIRIGDRHHDLPLLQRVAVEHRPHRGCGAAYDVSAGHDIARIVHCDHVEAVAPHFMGEDSAMLSARTVDVDAPDRAHELDGFQRAARLLAGPEQAERGGVRAR